MMVGSVDYNSNQGLYLSEKEYKSLKKENDKKFTYWIQYPKDVINDLSDVSKLRYENSFLKRIINKLIEEDY